MDRCLRSIIGQIGLEYSVIVILLIYSIRTFLLVVFVFFVFLFICYPYDEIILFTIFYSFPKNGLGSIMCVREILLINS